MTAPLAGRRLLVVEDDYLIAEEITDALRSGGAEVVGPVASIAAALDLLAETEHVDGAVIDLNLKGKMSYPVADALLARAIPFTFLTGYDQINLPLQYQGIYLCEKPTNALKVA